MLPRSLCTHKRLRLAFLTGVGNNPYCLSYANCLRIFTCTLSELACGWNGAATGPGRLRDRFPTSSVCARSRRNRTG
jgi:hypothetical protein